MFKYDSNELSKVAANITTRLMMGVPDVHSPTAVPQSDPSEPSVDDPPSSVGKDGGHTVLSPPTWNQPIHAPSNTGRFRTGSSSWLGTLSRIFRRSRVAPYQTQPQDQLVPTSASPTWETATALPTTLEQSASNMRRDNGSGTKKRWSGFPFTSRSDNISSTEYSKKFPSKKRHRVLRSNRVAPAIDPAGMPEEKCEGEMHKTTSVDNLAALDTTLQNAPAEKYSPEMDDEDEDVEVHSIDKKDLHQVFKKPQLPLILGRGHSSEVQLMRLRRPEGSSMLVAVKTIMGCLADVYPAMNKEIRALQAVEHCSIFPKLVGVVGNQSFAQEFIGDPQSNHTMSVCEALRVKAPISVENWVLIINDVITGLSALHKSGWAHCDLQNNNVLLCVDSSPSDPMEARWQGRIIDLGNAKRLTGRTRYCLDLTPSEKAVYYRQSKHIPAEVVEGLVPYGVKSDIYSLGVMMNGVACRAPGMSELIPLAETGLLADPDQRPTLAALMKELNVWWQDQIGHARVLPNSE